MAASAEVRFDLMEGEDINDFIASADSSNIEGHQIRCRCFCAYCRATGINFDELSELSNQDLDDVLARF